MGNCNRVVRWTRSGIVIGGASMIFSLCWLNGAGQAGEPGAVPLVAAPAPAAALPAPPAPLAPPPMLARPPEEIARKADRRGSVAADSDAYRCHPKEDIACTVVRETAQGVTVMTMRAGKSPAQAAAWSVVRGAPPGAVAYPGGIIYVVPTTPTAPSEYQAMAQSQESSYTANQAPILE